MRSDVDNRNDSLVILGVKAISVPQCGLKR